MKLVAQQRYYVDDIVCTHVGGDNRTCTEYVCDYGCITPNDKSIIKTAFEAFIFLSKLRELCPEHSAIEDFAQAAPAEREERKKVAPSYGSAQVVPIRRFRSDTVATETGNNDAEYSILNESDDIYSVRGGESSDSGRKKPGRCAKFFRDLWSVLVASNSLIGTRCAAESRSPKIIPM